MFNSAKNEYLLEIRKQYFTVSKNEISLILDEFFTVCGFYRKYAIRLISTKEQMHSKRKVRAEKYYSKATIDFLKDLWVVTNFACSKRIRATIPLLLPFYLLQYKNSLTAKES